MGHSVRISQGVDWTLELMSLLVCTPLARAVYSCLNEAMASMHPTKALLLETAIELIDEHGPQGFTVDALLEKSKISKGSMYHHFEDFHDVIESAQVSRFSRHVRQDSETLIRMFSRVETREEMFATFEGVVHATSGPDRADARLDRATIIGLSKHSKNFAQALAEEQQILTDALADVARELKERGLIRHDVDPRALSVFVQAYSFGRVLDDISTAPLSEDEWAGFVVKVLRSFL